jgi:hypothetical protein
MMRFLLIILTILLIEPKFILAAPKEPEQLGTIMDPDEAILANIPSAQAKKNLPLFNDEEFPELPKTLRWEISLASKAFQVSNKLRNHSDLITALSKGVEYICFADLQRSLSYTPPNQDPNCDKILKLLTDVDAENPLAICINSGIDTEDCKKAYQYQSTVEALPSNIIKEYQERSGEDKKKFSFHNDLSVKLDSEKANIAQNNIRTQLQSLKNPKLSAKEAVEAKRKQQILLGQYLQVSCNSYRLVAFPKSISANTKTTSRKSNSKKTGTLKSSGKDSLEDLLNKGPFNNNANTINKESPKNRFRVVSKSCLDALSFVESIDNKFVAIPCRRDGMTAPSCIQARRQAQSQAPSTMPEVSSGSEGIERF